jgi:hypothetical protein
MDIDIIAYPWIFFHGYEYPVSIPVTRWVYDMWVIRIQYVILNFYFSIFIHNILFDAEIIV